MTENPKKQEDIGNIFDDFSIDESLKKEVEKHTEDAKKDIFYYISKLNIVFSTVNIIGIFIVILFFGYIFVQKSEQQGMYSFLEPLCPIFLGRGDIYTSGCSSISSTLRQYNDLVKQEEQAQIDLLAVLIPDVFSLGDFFSSRRVDFAMNSGISRLRPLEILAEFDSLQAQFSPIDKLEVNCQLIRMTKDSTIDLNCTSYSSEWDTSIYRLEDGILRQTQNAGGTSISKAANFIDFIENSPGSRFRIVERPNSFTTEGTQFAPYTRMTNFSFTVEYISEALIY